MTKINIAYLFAPAIFLITFWEYLFGLLGFLNLGMETLVLIVLAATLVLLIRSNTFRTAIIKSLYLPSTVAFFVLSLVSFIKTKDWLLYQWDEFTHWGHVVKIMYKYGELGPGTPTDYSAENYPPALSLFQYFVIDFSSGWREGLLFWSIHLIAISIIVSVLAKCSFKNFSEILLKLFVSIVAMSTFSNNFDNVYADPTLAITFGFLIFFAIKGSSLDSRWGLVFATTAGFLTLTKPIGIYFACAAILISIISTLFVLKFKSGWRTIFSFRPALTALIAAGAAWMSWGYYLASLNSSDYSPVGSVPGLSNSSGREQFVADVTSRFISSLFNTGLNPISYSNMPASKWTIACIAFFAIWMYLNGKRNILRNLAIGITLLVTSAGYFYIILNSYLTVFGPGEAAALASFPRYIATWYEGVIIAIVLLILSEFDLTKSEDSVSRDREIYNFPNKKQIGILLITFMALSSVSSIGNYVNLIKSPQLKGLEWRAPFDPMIKAIKASKMPAGSKVYIITQHKIGFEFYVLRYEMVGNQFGEMPFSIGSKNGDGDFWTEPTMDAKRWSKTLRDFDYVVLYITTDSFNQEFSSLFKGGLVEPNSVYKVQKLTDRVLLSKVE
jgi:hypothetical protein